MDFSFHFQLEQSEQVKACRIMYHRRWSTRAVYGMFGILLVLVSALYVRDLWRRGEGWTVGVVVVGLACLAGVTAAYVSPYFMVRNLRKNNRAAAGPHTYQLSATGLNATAPGATTSIEWANVAEAYETRDFFFLYIAKGMAILLPKRAVTAAQLPSLRSSLRSWIAERAHLLADRES
jgi:hypothetical protein